MLVSTRGGGSVTPSRAILAGIAPDGGLYVPDSFPKLLMDEIEALCELSYPDRVRRILAPLLNDFSEEELRQATEAAYCDRFENNAPAPVRTINGNTHLLELFHGPTLAFKDMALQILPHLLALAAKKNGITEEICILVATSGDTGKAALEGFCDVQGTQCIVFYPKEGVSRAQYLQMATQRGSNTHVIAVEGNFDDAQSGIKQIFSSEPFMAEMKAKGRLFSSANSINFGRLIPQVAYYFSAYADLVKRGAIRLGDPMHVVVPTGNFGNILAAEYARKMGLPIDKLICASNANRVLADFIQSGVYDINRPFYKTSSPSMDILVSSNLERYLFELAGRDAGQVVKWMDSLKQTGRYVVGADMLASLQGAMVGGWVSEADCLQTIQRIMHETSVLLDPHTAVAMALLKRYRQHTGDRTPSLIVATASPYKFGHAVAKALDCAEPDDFACCRALSHLVGRPIPPQIASLASMPVLHTKACAPNEMKKTLQELFSFPF